MDDCLVTIITFKLSWHFSLVCLHSFVSFTHRRTNRVSNWFVCNVFFSFSLVEIKYMIKYRFEQQPPRLLYLFFWFWGHQWPNNGPNCVFLLFAMISLGFSFFHLTDSYLKNGLGTNTFPVTFVLTGALSVLPRTHLCLCRARHERQQRRKKTLNNNFSIWLRHVRTTTNT